MTLFFGKKTRRDPSQQKELERWRHVLNGNRARPIVAFGRAIFARDSVYEDLGRIETPTLVMVGEEDKSTPPIRAQRIAEGIEGAKLVTIPDAAHISTIDGADVVNAALREHLNAASSGKRAPMAHPDT
jgi:pimeloyl-ACP methyl ester carboxylesterase